MKFRWFAHSKKMAVGIAYGALVILIAYGLIARAHPQKPIPVPDRLPNPFHSEGPVKVKAQFSQTKVVQGSDGQIYLQVDLQAPEGKETQEKKHKPTDFVVVLDRSGSMGDAKKISYALRAVESLVNQMGEADRFGLVTFDDQIETPLELAWVRPQNKEAILQKVRTITPRGSTNLGGGLLSGIQMVESTKSSGRAQRLILISDGLANVGITDPQELNKIATRSVKGEFVVSTIGVGLDFNENLMASLADYGTGSYYFLEDLASLDKVLAQEFYGASQIYARDLELRMNVFPGVEVVEASGYPIERTGDTFRIQPGHLYYGQTKTFFVTLRLPTHSPYSKTLGDAELRYEVNHQPQVVRLFDSSVKVACLPPERTQEALSSIRPGVFEQAWTKNNYGRFLKENAEKVRQGDQGGAVGMIKDFKSKLSAAYQAAPSPGMKNQLDELDKMEGEVNSAFTSTDQDTSLKRLSKGYQYQGIQNQRKSN